MRIAFWAVLIFAIVTTLATFAFWVLGAWTNDSRWGTTGFITLFLAAAVFLTTGLLATWEER